MTTAKSKKPEPSGSLPPTTWPVENLFHSNVTTLAIVFGLTKQAVSLWKNQGCPRNSDGTVSIPDSVQWRREQDTLTASAGGESEALEELREASAALKKLDLAERRGELAEVSQVEAEVSRMVISFKQALLALPAAVAPRLEGLEAREIAAVMTGEIERVLRDLKGAENDH